MRFQIEKPEKDLVVAEIYQIGTVEGSTSYEIHWSNGSKEVVQAKMVSPSTMELVVSNKLIRVPFMRKAEGQYSLGHDLITSDVFVQDPRDAHYSTSDTGAAAGQITVNMPGKIVSVMVELGQSIEQGDGVIIVEAMKMENALKATRSGIVSAIHVGNEDIVESGMVLLEIGDEE